jgi:hypothetical protein
VRRFNTDSNSKSTIKESSAGGKHPDPFKQRIDHRQQHSGEIPTVQWSTHTASADRVAATALLQEEAMLIAILGQAADDGGTESGLRRFA